MAGARKRWLHVAFISGFFRGVAQLVIRGGRTPENPYRRTDANTGGWYPDQFVTYQGLEDYVELLIPEVRLLRAEQAEGNALLRRVLTHLEHETMLTLDPLDYPALETH